MVYAAPGAAARLEVAFAWLAGRNGSRRVALGGPVIFGTVDASRRFQRAGRTSGARCLAGQ